MWSYSMDALLPRQQKIVDFMANHGAGLIFAPPGAGKTRSILTALARRIEAGQVNSAVIFGPLRVIQKVWPDEIKKWEFNLTYKILHGKTKDKALAEGAQLYLINFDGLDWLVNTGKRFDCLVIDESTCLKNTTTKRFKIMKKWAPLFKYRYGTTGTPVPNGLLNLFGQTFITVGGVLGRNITHYRTQYFYPSGYGGYDWRLQSGADKLIYKQLEPHCINIESADFPFGVQMTDVKFDLPPSVLKSYRELEREFVVELGGGTLEVLQASALSIKLRQLTSGVVASDTGDLTVHNERLAALKELISELDGQQVLIFYNFNTELSQLKKEFGDNLAIICGGLSAKEFDKALDAWNSGKVQYLAVQPQAGGHGLNLQEGGAHHYVWYSLTFDLEVYLQACARLARTGQKHNTVFGYHLIASNTIDERIAAVLKNKDAAQTGMLQALRDYYTAPVAGVSQHYAALNRQLHADRSSYGTHGKDWAPEVLYLRGMLGADATILDYGCGKGTLSQELEGRAIVHQYDPGIEAHAKTDWANCGARVLACTDVLEHVEPDAIDDVIASLVQFISRAHGVGLFVIGLKPSRKILPDGRNSHLILWEPDKWVDKIKSSFSPDTLQALTYTVKGSNLVVAVSANPQVRAVDLLTLAEDSVDDQP